MIRSANLDRFVLASQLTSQPYHRKRSPSPYTGEARICTALCSPPLQGRLGFARRFTRIAPRFTEQNTRVLPQSRFACQLPPGVSLRNYGEQLRRQRSFTAPQPPLRKGTGITLAQKAQFHRFLSLHCVRGGGERSESEGLLQCLATQKRGKECHRE